MKRIAMIVSMAALLAGAGCGGGPSHTTWTGDTTYVDPVDIGDPSGGMELKTSELGTQLTRGRSKTIEWMKISTPSGTRYLGGLIVVDRVIRQDAEDVYGVEIRLWNKSPGPIVCEARVYFLNARAERILGVQPRGVDVEVREDWKKIAIEGYGYQTIADSARMRGAVGFDLRVRLSGTAGEGKPDAGVGGEDVDDLRRALQEDK